MPLTPGAIRDWYRKRRHSPRTIAAYLRACGAEVGEDCFIVPTDLEQQIVPSLLKIGNHVAIAAGVALIDDLKAGWLSGGEFDGFRVRGPVVIHDNCFIGFRSILCSNIEIGPNSVVAAGSVVTCNVPANTLVLGAPARPFGSIARYRDKCLQTWTRQKPPGVQVGPGETWWTSRNLLANRELLRKHLLAVFHDRLL